jgi:hypothetical protein
MRRFILPGLLVAAVAAGCAGTGTVGYSATVTATAPAHDLVEIRPGVFVVANYNEPVFYADDFYWRYYNGTWYRSRHFGSGWVHARPPIAVLRIDRPYTYVRYRPRGVIVRRDGNRRIYREYRDDRYDRRHDRRVIIRDHR